jgi:phosphoglycolate phosphatase-like HAD superfamily hydrolase
MSVPVVFVLLAVTAFTLGHAPRAEAGAAADPLPSWNGGPARERILAFVRKVTDKDGPEYVRPAERIAVFDNDGTLWCERPYYFQLQFALDRARDLGAKDPELKKKHSFKALLEHDRDALGNLGEHEAAGLAIATHAGVTTEEYARSARAWLATARHPRFHRLYKECVYQPMLELLAYLRANGFKTFIVSGGGIDFVRCFAEEVYGIPPEQVIGSSAKTKFELRNGKAVLVKLPELHSLDDKEGKPINIHLHIGRRPLLAFGNSDGDLQMLQYTAAGDGTRLMLLLHHDDADREYAYDRHSHVGRLDKALDEAKRQGWVVVSMRRDFKKVFAFDR